MQKILFIPGLGERQKDYNNRLKGIEVFDIDWNKPRIPKKKVDILIGFSAGAIEAINAAERLQATTLILCSMTPVMFDINQVKVQTIIFICGEKEENTIIQTKKLYKSWKGKKKFIVIPGGDHKIDKKYEEVLLGTLREII